MYIYFANILTLIFLHYFFYKNKNVNLENFCWLFTIFFFSVFIGLRYEIGGDWVHYNKYYEIYGAESQVKLQLYDHLRADLVYVLINKIAHYTGTRIFGVNFICALIFMGSLANFLQDSKNRWLALAISFPIIILILAMGYSRQGLAFAFSLYLLKSLENRKVLLSFIYLILAICSHKTALLLSVYYLIYFWFYKKYLYFFILILFPIILIWFFWFTFEHLLYFYVGEGVHMSADGSAVRSFIILIVAFLFIVFKNRHVFMTKYQNFFYSCVSYVVIAGFPFSIVTSMAVDRSLLYFYSLKVAFVSLANLEDKKINIAVFIIVTIYFLYLTVWICFGNNSFSWVPYNFVGFSFGEQGDVRYREFYQSPITDNVGEPRSGDKQPYLSKDLQNVW